jgi:translation initiation factor IF-2
MAKIRVYELARELNMTNKVLLDKIKGMNIEVRSHMSSLDDETVRHIKTALLGKQAAKVDEKRVKSTVIRRRRKKVQKEAVPAETVPKAEPQAIHPAVELPTEKKPPAEAETVPTAEVPSAKVEAIEEKAFAEKKEEIVKPKETAEAAVAEKTVPAEESKATEVRAKPEPALKAEKIVPEAEEMLPEPEKKKPAVGPELRTTEPVEPKKPLPAKAKKKTRKKAKKSVAAKIIKLPDVMEEKPLKEKTQPEIPKAKIAAPAAEKKPAAIPTPRRNHAAEEVRHEKKGAKAAEEFEGDKKFVKKKIAFRKKAVVEGKALYDETERGKKGRKGGKGAKAKAAVGQKTMITTPKAIKRRIKIDDTIVLSDLAKRMGIKANEMIQKLMMLGVMVTVNQTIDFDTAALVAAEFNYEVERASFEEETLLHVEKDRPEELLERPPVVTIMGHVDHGKTSLLDVIRQTHVTDAEAGGITQHIGAYHVITDKGQIAFLDTPGHEAFTAMRSRGAKVTDIVILVVAADDGVMPQTIEAINHSKAAGVPIIVAVNKIDKENAEPDRVKRELSDHGIISEEWGGENIFVNVSAKKNIGIDDLLDMVLLQAEVMELKANPDKLARGHVIEAKLDSGRGPVATILIQEGTLHTGEAVVCGLYYGKIRAMLDDQGKPISKAGPSKPVEILGLNGVPMAGDELVALADEKDAKQVSGHRVQKQRAKELAKSSRLSLERLFEKMEEGEIKELNLIIKADVHGSIEALKDSLSKLSTDKVKINTVHAATGTVTESDVSLATVSNAIIIGFNVRPGAKVQEMAAEENVDMRFYNIIYNAIKDIKDAMVGMMEPTFEERVLGRAEVRETFVIPKKGTIAGSFVTDGKIERGQRVRLLREGIIMYDGKLASLRRFKDDVKEVNTGYECGIGIENFNDIKVGDTIECYYLEEIKPTMQ